MKRLFIALLCISSQVFCSDNDSAIVHHDFMRAIYTGQTSVVVKMLSEHPEFACQTPTREEAPVYITVCYGRVGILKALIEKGAIVQLPQKYDLISRALLNLFSCEKEIRNNAPQVIEMLLSANAPIYESTKADARKLLRDIVAARCKKTVMIPFSREEALLWPDEVAPEGVMIPCSCEEGTCEEEPLGPNEVLEPATVRAKTILKGILDMPSTAQ